MASKRRVRRRSCTGKVNRFTERWRAEQAAKHMPFPARVYRCDFSSPVRSHFHIATDRRAGGTR